MKYRHQFQVTLEDTGYCVTLFQISGISVIQEAKHVESWPNTSFAWAGWSTFDIPVDRYGGVHYLLHCTSSPLGSPTCH
jgi:hypothetical protein